MSLKILFIITWLIVFVLSNLSMYVKNEDVSKLLLVLSINIGFSVLGSVVYSQLPD